MKKFRYRLEGLLKVKEHIEKERQKEHAAALKRVRDQEGHLVGIDRHREATYQDQRARQMGSLNVAEMLIYSRYLVKLKKDTLANKEVLRALNGEAGKSRTALLKASREKKIYEKLKEKQHQKYLDEVRRLETKETDEIGIQAHRRKTRQQSRPCRAN